MAFSHQPATHLNTNGLASGISFGTVQIVYPVQFLYCRALMLFWWFVVTLLYLSVQKA